MDVSPPSTEVSITAASALPVEPLAATPENGEHCRPILKRILDLARELSQPVPPPALWRRFGSSQFVRRFSSEPGELLSRLSQDFTAYQLLAAHVAVRTQSGELQPSKLFAADGAFFLRTAATGRAAGDLVNQRGRLSSGTREWLELAAQTTNGKSPHEIPFVLCADDEELYVLVRLRLSCSPLAGVDQLTGKQVDSLFSARAKFAELRRFQLVLLGWQPGTLVNEPSAKNLAAIRHVADIQQIYGFDPHTVFSVWLPSDSELGWIRKARSFMDPAAVADQLSASLQTSLYPPDHALTLLSDLRPATWATARQTLERTVELSREVPHSAEARVALEKLERAFQDQVVRPLENAEGKTGFDALHSIMGADLAALWYEDLELVHAGRRVIAGYFPGSKKRIDDAAFDRKLRLVSEFVKLARANAKKMTAL